MEALACIGHLAEALHEDMEESVRSMLDLMFAGGLSPTLVESLKQISSRHVPSTRGWQTTAVQFCAIVFFMNFAL